MTKHSKEIEDAFMALLDNSKTSDEIDSKLEALGVSVKDDTGNYLTLQEVLENLWVVVQQQEFDYITDKMNLKEIYHG